MSSLLLIWIVIAGFVYLMSPLEQLRKLLSSSILSRNFAAIIALQSMLWSLDVELISGLSLHFLMITTATLVIGLRLTCLAGLASLLLMSAAGMLMPELIAEQWLLRILPAAAITYTSLLLVRHYLPHHLFIYIFVNAFITAAIAITCSILCLAAWYAWSGAYTGDEIQHHLLRMLPLMLFPEAMLNGMVITVMVIYKPEWVRTYQDLDYLGPDN
ncbi:energy-coupling factor ABC transporter permease [Echinimonas agarilytica]|uniref:Energy-coupling factor ABC transporter permease n=1 Tax=Echinimonas agarilytica TaxID=1215918 RepID=A0AA42B943_9GAMM|nr:energy-coupling factor ABC transporter permease [Echinimonas agarilytica]MCM2680861.1 energy-coupling factor ABC transporter permease [Echinimonas agarilytica]